MYSKLRNQNGSSFGNSILHATKSHSEPKGEQNERSENLIKTVALVVLAGLLVVGIFVGTEKLRSLNHKVIDVENRLTFSGDESLTSKQERKDFWKGALELIKEKPIFGWGPFSFRYAYNPIQKTLLGNSDHPHNIFLKI
ncbi:MAG: O-antigen ligase family protein [Patescibacteria group bacterium]